MINTIRPQEKITLKGHLKSGNSQKQIAPDQVIESEQVQQLFKGFDDALTLKERDDYLTYLKRVKEHFKEDLSISLDEIVEEIPFWKSRKFVWPNILVNSVTKQPIFLWAAHGTKLRLERVDKKRYTVSSWENTSIIEQEKEIYLTYEEVVENIIYTYSKIEEIVYQSGVNWKDFFSNV